MTNLTETSTWNDGVPMIAEGDWVEGGPDGVDNAPHLVLASRTRYLKAAVESLTTGKASSVHNHAIGDVTGLQQALNGKAASAHTHLISDIDGLQSALAGKAESSHLHEMSDVTGLQNALAGKSANEHHHGNSEIDALAWSKLTAGGVVPEAGIPMMDSTGTYALKLVGGVLTQVKQ